MTLEVDSSNFEAEVLNSNIPVLVDFWAEWCGPCRMLAPTIDAASMELSGIAKVCKLNIDKSPAIASQYGIRSIPTLILFLSRDQQEIKIGSISLQDMVLWVKSKIGDKNQ